MKTKFFTFLLALLFTAIGGVNAAGTYTVRVTDDYALSTTDLQAIMVLLQQQVISLTTSGNLRIVKNSSGTTLFNIDWDTQKCYLSSSTSSANNMLSSITISSTQLINIGAPYMVNYTSIAMTFPDPEAYAARLNNTLTFYYDHQRSVHTNTYSLNTGSNNPGWYSISESITSVQFHQTFANARPTSCYRWFAEMTSITNITGLNYLNTSNVTNMSYMFDGSTGFNSLDVSALNTANVTNMEAMFRNCTGLSGLYVSSLNTAKVTNMKEMFKNCSGIVNLDLSSLNVSNVTTTTGILQGCSELKSLNLSAALLNKIEDGGCSGIGTTTSPCALYYPTTSHPTFSEATNVYVKWKGGYFNSANRRTYAYMSGSTLIFCYDDYYDSRKASSTVYDLNYGSNNPSWYSNRTNISSVSFSSSFANARPLTCYMWFSGMNNLTSISGLTNLNTSSVTNMYNMFALCQQLTSLNVSSFNTSNVTNMESMFAGLSQIKSLNVSSFNTAKVTNMQNMFKNCSQLTSLNLSNFTITSSTNTSGMLNNMLGLQTLTLSTSLVNYLNSTACTHIGTDIYGTLTTPCTLIYPANLHLTFTEVSPNYVKWKDGYFNDPNMKPYACLSGNTLTFYYDDNYTSRQATSTVYDLTTSDRPGWYNSRQNITSVVFNSSFANARPTTCESWFEGMNNLTTITGLSNLNTSNVTNMAGMFNGCSRLTSLNLNLSTFNTSNVTDMASMFYGCSGLTSLNVSNFNTAKVTDMYRMFYGCSGLTSLNASNFTTTKVTDFQEMFYGCSGLKSLDVSSFVTNVDADWVRGFVSGCTALESLSLSAALTSRIEVNGCTDIGTATAPCTLIYPTSVCLSYSDATPTYFRWKGGYFTSPNVKPYACLRGNFLTFYYDDQYVTSQASSTVYDLNTGLDDPDWISSAESITEVEFAASFRNARPTSCRAWFAMMSNLSTITALSYLNTSEVTDMAYMFMNCSHFDDLDLSQLNTAKVTTMEGMFFGCTPLINLNISSFNTENVTNMSYMFYTCRGLENLDLSNFNAEHVTNTERMFFYCSGLESLSLSAALAENMNNNACEGVGTAESPCVLNYPSDVELTFTEETPNYVKWKIGYFLPNASLVKAYAVFNGNTLTFYYDDASSSKSGIVYKLNTGENDPAWIPNAESITEVVFDASFSDARPTSCYAWFARMKNLTSITGLNYLNTSEVTTMANMFMNCSGFTNLDLSQLNTTNVTNMSQMFYRCTNLTNLDVSHFNTANVESMYAMFFQCLSLTNLDVSNFNTANVRSMSAMFNSCSSLTSLDVSNFQTDNITDTMDTEGMFYYCSGMKSLSLSAALIDIIHPNACSGVGTTESPCVLIYPEGCSIEKEETGDGWFRWSNGYFTEAPAYLMGDVNSDDKVTIADVTALVNIILGKDTAGLYNRDAADVNGDHQITIADVTALVNVILGK